MQISYLRVNLAKVLIGLDSKKDDFRLSRLLISLLPFDNLDKMIGDDLNLHSYCYLKAC